MEVLSLEMEFLCRNDHARWDKQKWFIDPSQLKIIPESDCDLFSLHVIRLNIRDFKHLPIKKHLNGDGVNSIKNDFLN